MQSPTDLNDVEPDLTIETYRCASCPGRSDHGRSRTILTVWSSTLRVRLRSIMSMLAAAVLISAFLGSSSLPNVNMTSSAVNGLPSCHVTPVRSLTTHSVALSLASKDSASWPTTLPCGSKSARRDHTFNVRATCRLLAVGTCG